MAQPAKPQPAKPQPTKPMAPPAKPQPAKPQPAKPQPAKPQPAKQQPAKPQPKPKPQPPAVETESRLVMALCLALPVALAALIFALSAHLALPMHFAARRGLGGVINPMTVRWQGLEAADKQGQTALHLAAQFGKIAVIRKLLQAGADPHARDRSGWTVLSPPLHHAAGAGRTDATRELLMSRAKGDPSKVDKQKWTPLHLAAFAGKVQTARVLIVGNGGKKASLDAKDSKGNTPLHVAIESGRDRRFRLEIAETLVGFSTALQLGAKNSAGRTALHSASSPCDAAVVNMLLQNKASPSKGKFLDAVDSNGRSALIATLPTTYSHPSRPADVRCAELLVKEGADLTLKTKGVKGETAYRLAKRWKQDRLAALLERGESAEDEKKVRAARRRPVKK